MRPLDLALHYMDIFYSGKPIDTLKSILADDLLFEGPFFTFHSAEEYLTSLRQDPPQEMRYEILQTFENDRSACLIYQFSKPGISTCMAQTFLVASDHIHKILLIFDTGVFHD